MKRPFSRAFDAYSEIRWRVTSAVDNEIFKSRIGKFQGRCPCCVYRLRDEEDLEHTMLVAMDGNESLRRVKRSIDDGTGERISIERLDERTREAAMYIERSVVDEFAHEVRSRRNKVRYLSRLLPFAKLL